MLKKTLIVGTIVLLLGLSVENQTRAEIFILKDGQKVQGEIVRQNPREIEIKIRGGGLILNRNEIKKVYKDDEQVPEEPPLKIDYNKSIKGLNKIIEKDPSNAFYRHLLGIAYLEKGDYDKAIKSFTEAIEVAIEINPKGMYYVDRARAYFKKGDFDHALADATTAVEQGDRFGYYVRADVYVARGQYDKCWEEYYAMKESNPVLSLEVLADFRNRCWADKYLKKR